MLKIIGMINASNRNKKTCTDYLEHFEIMIAGYNAGSKNVDLIYKDLVDLGCR